MGMDVLYARCSESLIDEALHDEHKTAVLDSGGGCIEELDLGRDQFRLFTALAPDEEILSNQGFQEHWARLALVGDEFLPLGHDYGYGKPRFLRPPQVAEVARQLTALDDASIDPALLPRVQTMRAFYANAARDGNAVVIAFS